MSRAPSSASLDSQTDPPQIDQKPYIETVPINLNSNDECIENLISRKTIHKTASRFPKPTIGTHLVKTIPQTLRQMNQ